MQEATLNIQRKNAVDALLRAIDDGDLISMERRLETLRCCLASSPRAGSLGEEQADALSGLADEIERSLQRMRAAAAGEMARIQGAAPLLAHLCREPRAPLAKQ